MNIGIGVLLLVVFVISFYLIWYPENEMMIPRYSKWHGRFKMFEDGLPSPINSAKELSIAHAKWFTKKDKKFFWRETMTLR